ncbi:uncharacterized protein [Amphiura filiformis]|uniref:uncharacterized protein n=1 Tax=Amphiura filiformis TaxID=82378 RepID=UPI003B211946
MRVFGCLLLACLAIGAYGAALDNLEKLERRLLVDLLEARSGGDSGPPPCDADHVGEAQDWPKDCDSSDPCTCTFTCVEDGSGGYKHSATPINDGYCPPAPCDLNRDGVSVEYPKDCQNTDTCTCTLTCEDDLTASGETEWDWTEDGDDCPSDDDDDTRDVVRQ